MNISHFNLFRAIIRKFGAGLQVKKCHWHDNALTKRDHERQEACSRRGFVHGYLLLLPMDALKLHVELFGHTLAASDKLSFSCSTAASLVCRIPLF